jgi:hypothetical protein
MTIWQWLLIATGAVILIAWIIVAVASRSRTTTRKNRRDKLNIVALTSPAATHFVHRWQHVQLAFVDDPAAAVGAADRLITDVMRERGYPVDHFEQRAADISVDHRDIVEHYRAAHRIHLAQRKGDVGTERQREAFLHYRTLFDSLLETNDNDTSQEARA